MVGLLGRLLVRKTKKIQKHKKNHLTKFLLELISAGEWLPMDLCCVSKLSLFGVDVSRVGGDGVKIKASSSWLQREFVTHGILFGALAQAFQVGGSRFRGRVIPVAGTRGALP